jgi:hypothetical protein
MANNRPGYAGTLAATGSIIWDLAAAATDSGGFAAVGLQISGTWVGTVAFEATIDGTNWFSVTGLPIGSTTGATGATANGQWKFPAAGWHSFRARCSAYTSGTITATMQATVSADSAETIVNANVTADSELSAAAALADATSNPTTSMIGANLLGWNGATWDRVRVQTFRVDVATVTINSIATVWTPTSGKKFRLLGGSISVSAAASVLFEDNAAAAFVFRTPKLLADTPYNFDLGNGKLSATTNNVLKATGSANCTLVGTLYGTEE